MAGDKEIDVKTLDRTNEPDVLIFNWLWKWKDESKGILNGGEAMCNWPPDQTVMMNATTPLGHGNLIYAILTYTMPKFHYSFYKLSESLTVSPSYPEMYGRIISKKREIEGHIKSGMASAAQAVADYDLLKHDERKYREVLDYFKEGNKDEHVLRSLFIDRVDAHTGEGYSMISMTKRWPTIITDFIRLSIVPKDERADTKKIRKQLEISEAEATVLKTKDRIFNEWKTIFFPDIKDRYARIKNLLEARKKSIDEYREWLKPYVANLKMMREGTEINPSQVLTKAITPWHKPNAMYEVRLLMWKMLTAEEVGKPGLVEGEIEPYDDFVRRLTPKIEKHYEIRIVKSRKDAKKIIDKENLVEDDVIVVDEMLAKWYKGEDRHNYEGDPPISKDRYYYCMYDIEIISPIFKMEAGKEEVDDWNCMITPFLVSQNIVLLALLEIEAKERWMKKYVKELIGVREIEDKIRKEVEKRYGLDDSEKKKSIFAFYKNMKARNKALGDRFDNWVLWNKPKMRHVLKYFMRIGPYETVTNERLSKMYGRYMGGGYTDPLIKFVKAQFGKLSGVQPP
ncbi:MAG: hypothetical protein JW789_03610 [Candidatus Aenigmarchaeota archaeon]|nr:hypothetical protein [Candidatus Aenigmarchaeota archaeon]